MFVLCLSCVFSGGEQAQEQHAARLCSHSPLSPAAAAGRDVGRPQSIKQQCSAIKLCFLSSTLPQLGEMWGGPKGGAAVDTEYARVKAMLKSLGLVVSHLLGQRNGSIF